MKPDRELRCPTCYVRMFTAAAPALVAAEARCRRCGDRMELAPAATEHLTPRADCKPERQQVPADEPTRRDKRSNGR